MPFQQRYEWGPPASTAGLPYVENGPEQPTARTQPNTNLKPAPS